MIFDCGCRIRWLQLWQQRGDMGLRSQQLYCDNSSRKIPLQEMNISKCGKFTYTVCFIYCVGHCMCCAAPTSIYSWKKKYRMFTCWNGLHFWNKMVTWILSSHNNRQTKSAWRNTTQSMTCFYWSHCVNIHSSVQKYVKPLFHCTNPTPKWLCSAQSSCLSIHLLWAGALQTLLQCSSKV